MPANVLGNRSFRSKKLLNGISSSENNKPKIMGISMVSPIFAKYPNKSILINTQASLT
jgi:hypothetical protein